MPNLPRSKQKCDQFEACGDPIISVDCKKKELIGTFKNNGREWQAKGEETNVNVYDFLSLADGKAIPYGIYDLVHNRGFVNVGSIMTRQRLPWEVSGDGGSSPAKRSIPRSATCSLPPMGAVPTGSGIGCGRRNSRSLPMKSRSRLRWRIIRLPPANGTRSSIGSFPLFRSIGVRNPSRLWKSCLNSSLTPRPLKA